MINTELPTHRVLAVLCIITKLLYYSRYLLADDCTMTCTHIIEFYSFLKNNEAVLPDFMNKNNFLKLIPIYNEYMPNKRV